MKVDDRAVLKVVRRSMVARIATLSGSGRPCITPLYVVYLPGRIWLSTADWTLAARDVTADPRVSILFQREHDRFAGWIVRLVGHASMRADWKAVLRAAVRYSPRLGQIGTTLKHGRLLLLRRRYRAQSAEKGQACVIEVIPEQAGFPNDHQPG